MNKTSIRLKNNCNDVFLFKRKQCLRTKMNASKLFNGTYLVDPSINDLSKKS